MGFLDKSGMFVLNGFSFKEIVVKIDYFYYRYRGIGNHSQSGSLSGVIFLNYGPVGKELDFANDDFKNSFYSIGVNNLDYILSEKAVPSS